MADAGENRRISVERAARSVRELQRVRNRQRARNRRADHSPFRQRFTTPTLGCGQPSGPASGRQRAQNRGVAHAPAPSVTPAKCVSRHRTPRSVCYFSACNSSVWRDLRQQPSRAPVHPPPVSSHNLAFPNCGNHRSSSRPPSRRQPFQSRSLKPGKGRRMENAPIHVRSAIRI